MKTIALRGLQLMGLSAAIYLVLAGLLSWIQWGDRRAICHAVPYLQRKGGQEERMFADWQKTNQPDFIVIGSSHAYRGYDPREFAARGYSLFNAGTSSQNAVASSIILAEIIVPQKNTTVMLDLYDVMFSGTHEECYFRLAENVPDHESAWSLFRAKKGLMMWNALAARYFSRQTEPESRPDDYVKDGFCVSADTITRAPEKFTEVFSGNEEYRAALDGLIGSLRQNGVKVIAVSHPARRADGHVTFHQKFRSFVLPVLKRHGIEYLDFSLDHSLNDYTDFADENHLNVSGVKKFNQILLGSLTTPEKQGPL